MTHVMQLSQKQVMPEIEKKQRRLTVAQIVPIGFGALLAIVGISTTVTEVSKANLKETQALVEQGFKVKELLRLVEKDLVEAETGQRGYLLTGVSNYLEPYDSGRKLSQEHLTGLKKTIIDPNQRVRTEKLEPIIQHQFAELE